MSLLPISQSDLQLCAQRWGWDDLDGVASMLTDNGRLYLWAEREDCFNAAAILDRERVLMLKGWSIYLSPRQHRVFVCEDDTNTTRLMFIDFTPEQLATPNFQSWLLVQLTLQLPPEVWK